MLGFFSYSDAWFFIGLMAGYLMGVLFGGPWWGFIFVGLGAALWQGIFYIAPRVWRRMANR